MMLSKDEIVNGIREKQKHKRVIIAGAGIVGRVLLGICSEAGIRVECFCDSSIKTASEGSFCGLRVLHTQAVREKYDDAAFIVSAAAIKDVVDLLHESGFSDWYAGGLLLKDLDISGKNTDASLDYTNFAIDNCILCHNGYLNPDKLFLRSIDLIITERCSLRCRDCSNLMQYYEKPQNCDSTMLLRSIDMFCSVVDEVMDFRIIGGETFMNKQWHVPVARLLDEPKAKRIVLYTNGTIIPDKRHIPLMQNKKVIVIATDYGKLSRKLAELEELLKKNRITHHVLKMTEWLDCSAIKKRGRTPKENRDIFKLCCAKNMATLSDGNIFRCPYAANAFRLRAVPDREGDYVSIFDDLPAPELKKRLKAYIWDKDYLEICDYCNGRPLSGVEVVPGVQTDKPLPYEKYNVNQ